MASKRITNFKGIAPRISPRLLGPENAQVAANCSLTSGELRPLNSPKIVSEPTKGIVIQSLFRADGFWFTWDTDVDVARSPLPGEQRFIYTGDGEPRITTIALATTGLGNDYPVAARPLGLVGPQTAPTVTPAGTGTSGETVTRFYVYTFYDDWNQESAPSPVSAAATSQTDDTWAISNMDTSPPNSGSGTAVVAGSPGLYVTTFTNSTNHWLRAGDQIIFDTSGDTVTVVSVPSATTFTVSGDYSAETDWDRVAQWGTVTKRIYRTAGTAAGFQLVVQNLSAATTSYNDTISDADILGDDLLTNEWVLPPIDLAGVISLPSGALAGFSGNELCFSEPFQPHAWPEAYRLRSTWPIVSLQYYSSGLVAGTEGNPFQVIGLDPGQMAAQPVNGVYPCVSKRSTVSFVDSVGFATEQGFVTIGDAGVNVLTKDLFSRNEWYSYDPETMFTAVVRGKLYIMSRTDLNRLFVFDFLEGTGLTVAYVDATALHADATSGHLYFGEGTNLDVREFDPSVGVYMSQDWKSKEYILPAQLNLGAARVTFTSRYTLEEYDAALEEYDAKVAANEVLAASGYVGGAINSRCFNCGGWTTGANPQFRSGGINGSWIFPVEEPRVEAPGVNFLLYGDNDELKFAKFVTSELPFRLPSGYKTDNFSVRVQGQVLVKAVQVGETVISLGQV